MCLVMYLIDIFGSSRGNIASEASRGDAGGGFSAAQSTAAQLFRASGVCANNTVWPPARLTNGVVTRILRREYCHFVVQTFVIRARYFRYEEFFLRMNRTRERELSKNEKTYAVHTLIPLSVLRSNVPCKTGGFMEPPHPFEGAKSAMSQFVGSVTFSTLTFS